VCLLLLGPDTLRNYWLQFEAGLFLGSRIARKKLVPVAYAGTCPSVLPATVANRQSLLLRDAGSFDAFVRVQLLDGARPAPGQSHADFMMSAPTRALRSIAYGEFGLLAEDAKPAEILKGLSFPRDPELILPAASGEGRLVSVRIAVVPRALGPVVHWKCGITLRRADRSVIFQFHLGCHNGLRSWSLYPNQQGPRARQLALAYRGKRAAHVAALAGSRREARVMRWNR